MHGASYNLLVQYLVCVSVWACVPLFDKYMMVFAHLHIAAFTQSDLHFSDCILVCVCVIGGVCETWSYYRHSVRKRETQVHICVLHASDACVSTYGFRCHYSRNISSCVGWPARVCQGDIIFAITSLSHVHLLFIGPHKALPLHLTPWKSMRASRSGVKIEPRSKYFACWKLKWVGGARGARKIVV